MRDRRAWVIVSLVLASALSSIDQDSVSLATPSVVKELGTQALYGWVFTAYTVSSAVALVVFGRLADVLGTKRMLIFGLTLLLASSALSGSAGSMEDLIAYRFAQGIAGGTLVIVPLLIVSHLFPEEEWGKWQGILFAAFGVGNLLGPALGGVLTQYVGWRWVFWVNVPLAVVVLLPVLLHRAPFERAVGEGRRLPDMRATALFILSSGTLLVAVDSLKSPSLWLAGGLLAFGTLLGHWFFRSQLTTSLPLIPVSMFRERSTLGLLLVSFLIVFSTVGAAAYMPLYMQGIKGLTPAVSGIVALPVFVAAALSSVIVGMLLSWLRRPRPLLLSMLLLMTASLCLISRVTPDTAVWLVVLYGSFLGAGAGGSLPVTMIMVQISVANEHLTAGTSVQTFVRALGASAGLSVSGAIIASAVRGDVMRALQWIFVIGTVAALCALILGALIPGLGKRPSLEPLHDHPSEGV